MYFLLPSSVIERKSVCLVLLGQYSNFILVYLMDLYVSFPLQGCNFGMCASMAEKSTSSTCKWDSISWIFFKCLELFISGLELLVRIIPPPLNINFWIDRKSSEPLTLYIRSGTLNMDYTPSLNIKFLDWEKALWTELPKETEFSISFFNWLSQ